MQKRFTWFRTAACLVGIGIFLAGPTIALAQEAVSDGRPTTLFDYYKQGGFTMWPLLAEAIWATAVFIEMLVRLRRSSFCPPPVLQQVREATTVGDYQKAWQAASANASPLAKMLSAAIAKLPEGREAVEETAIEAAANINADLKIKLSYLSLNAAVAPMMGLFGTISGMIGAFNAMAYGGAVGDPTKLAGDIGEALITTYGGLVIAIPCMMAYYIMQARLKQMITALQTDFNLILDTIKFSDLPEDLMIVTGAGATAAAPAAAGGGGTVPCPNCNKEIKVGVKACPHCNTEMDWE